MYALYKNIFANALGCIGRHRACFRRELLSTVTCVLALMLPVSLAVRAQQADAPAQSLKLASWDVSQPRAVLALGRPPEDESKPTWRTSFGSERRTQTEREAPRPVITADVVLLQGVTDIRALRRVFPARVWRIIVSRTILSDGAAARAPVVAVRSTADLRVTAQDQMIIPADPASAEKAASPYAPVSAIGVRVEAGNRPLWVVSMQFDDACKDASVKCEALEALSRWRDARLVATESVAIGGRPADPGQSALPPPPCLDQAVLLYAGPQSDTPRRASAFDDPVLGCIASIEVLK